MCLAVIAAGHPVGEALLLFAFVLQAADLLLASGLCIFPACLSIPAPLSMKLFHDSSCRIHPALQRRLKAHFATSVRERKRLA
jgi:hypothetical protein